MCQVFCCFVLGLTAAESQPSCQNEESPSAGRFEKAIILTQVPADRSWRGHSVSRASRPRCEGGLGTQGRDALATTRLVDQEVGTGSLGLSEYGEGARLIALYPDLSISVLSENFDSAADPDVSFDASHVLFAAKRTPADTWNIYEMRTDGTEVRSITDGKTDRRHPGYQPALYTIVSPKPWYQITFASSEIGVLNESGAGKATNLYSCKLDGTTVRRLTYNLSNDTHPCIMPDGRILFASRQRSTLACGVFGRISLFGINIDGTDCAAFCTDEGKRMKHMPCVTTKGLAVFVEADKLAPDGSGDLGCVKLRRPLHSYRPITKEKDGLFHSPSPLPDGSILVSRRARDGSDTYAVYRLDPSTGRRELIFDDPKYHDIQAKMVYSRPEPDGRSSVVKDNDPNGKLFCLDVYISDLEKRQWLGRGAVKRLRVLEGIPPTDESVGTDTSPTALRLAQRRILGEIDIKDDGSFNVEIPAGTPIELQTVDANGMALRTCSWIWAMNHEPRGCIGCHEDGELTPENILVEAVAQESIQLTLPPKQRRSVDFRRDVMPIIASKCVECHNEGGSAPNLNDTPANNADANARPSRSYESLLAPGDEPGRGKYVHPGRARTSPLIWHIFGKNTSRPWDEEFSKGKAVPMPTDQSQELTQDEKRTFVEWIDMGALWDGIPQHDDSNRGTDE